MTDAACDQCGAALAAGQHYCLNCGARAGEPDPRLRVLMARVRTRKRPPAPEPTAPVPAPPARGRRLSLSALRIPSPRISALLVAAFAGFGILLGAAAASRPGDSLAASARSVKLVLPAATASASVPESEEGAGENEPPEVEEETETPGASQSTSTSTASKENSKGSESGAKKQGENDSSETTSPATKLPPVKHVFVIALSNEPYAAVFGPEAKDHYLARTLEKRGELLVRYDAVAHAQLANEIALISGQGPTLETAANCPNYTAITPAHTGANAQVLGNGCVYPASTTTLPGQLLAKHLSWRAYVEGTGEGIPTPPTCSHPALGQADPTSALGAGGSAYATFRNPFVYFQSITGSPACATHDAGLNQLPRDLASAKRTPSFSYIVPDRCHDGDPEPCSAQATTGEPSEDFLRRVVPEILASKAYTESGLLVITVDQAPPTGEFADSSSCCGQPQFPNLAATSSGTRAAGGGTVGALLLSPFVKAASTNQEAFNHFSLLRTMEDLFGLGHIGYAALPAVKSFAPSMFITHSGG